MRRAEAGLEEVSDLRLASEENITFALARPLRSAASLRLAVTRPLLFGSLTRGHRPLEINKDSRQVVDLPRIRVAEP